MKGGHLAKRLVRGAWQHPAPQKRFPSATARGGLL